MHVETDTFGMLLAHLRGLPEVSAEVRHSGSHLWEEGSDRSIGVSLSRRILNKERVPLSCGFKGMQKENHNFESFATLRHTQVIAHVVVR